MATYPERSDIPEREPGRRAPEPTEEDSLTAGGFFLEMVKVFILAAIIIIPVRTFFFQPFFVQGSSMEPNFEDGEYLIVNEFGYKRTDVGPSGSPLFTVSPFHDLTRQEPIVFRSPQKPDVYLIKRVIGLPGETVRIDRSKIVIANGTHPDGFVLDESAYLSPTVVTTDMKSVTLGPDQYLVLGDNRMNSLDSRVFGPVGRDLVIGRVLLRAWPLSQAWWYR